jgi:hypothetical protein
MPHHYRSFAEQFPVDRRDFLKTLGVCSAAVTGGAILGTPEAFGWQAAPPPPVETNIADFMKVPRTKFSVPGPFPGKVVKIADPKSLVDDKFDGKVIAEMVKKGIAGLTGQDMKKSFGLLFDKKDIVGIKVNPVGPPLINTRPEVVDAVVAWLVDAGLPAGNIIIWDRFDYMLKDAGYTPQRFPAVKIEGIQTMDEDEKSTKWMDKDGNHVSINNFDKDVFLYAKGITGKGVKGYPNDQFYLNQHVFNGEYSYFGKLVTQRLTKIINIAAYKDTGGHAISMATKNIGYGSLCNVGRLHAPLGLKTNVEVIACPVIRDKMVLNITDGLRGQYEGGPDKNAQFVYPNHALYFATDPFALDMICHNEVKEKRRAMGRTINDNPRFTDYLRYAEELKLGFADVAKIKVITA